MVEQVGAVDDPVQQGATINLNELVDPATRNAGVERAMEDALDTAISNAASSPIERGESVSLQQELSGGLSGSYGDEKRKLVADLSSKDTDLETVQDTPETAAMALTELMYDLTTWQITWGVAQSAQKDLSHVLKT